MSASARSRLQVLLPTLLVLGSVGTACAADRFVATTGSDAANDCSLATSPCHTLQHALDVAENGDTIKIAKGHYATMVAITAPPTVAVTIEGGWSADFASRDLQKNATMFRGGQPGTAPLTLYAGSGGVIDLTLDGATVTNGENGGIAATAQDGGMVTLNISNDVIRANKTSIYPGGGGILAIARGTGSLQLAVTDSTLQGNRAKHRPEGTGGPSGGISAIAFEESSLDLTVARSLFRQNRSESLGGGAITVFASSTGTTHVSVTNTTIVQNKASHSGGGGLEIDSGSSGPVTIDVSNTLFGGNKASVGAGGGLLVDASFSTSTTLRVTNCTVADNFAPEGGGGIALVSIPTTLTNTVAWGNHVHGSMLAGNDLNASSSVVDLDHDDIGVSFNNSGTFNDLGGNLNADPLLAHPPKDLHLTTGSPCIDTGTCAGAPTTDFEGDPRPSGAGCDIGADEFVP